MARGSALEILSVGDDKISRPIRVVLSNLTCYGWMRSDEDGELHDYQNWSRVVNGSMNMQIALDTLS